MSQKLVTSSGQSLELGVELGRGGEGSVFEVSTAVGQVAKLYHRALDQRKQAKLAFMVTVSSDRLTRYAAWPQATLHAVSGGPVLGFLMPKVVDREPIHVTYSPAQRRQAHPTLGWNYLVFVARNTAAAFETLHAHGAVLGDINQGNVLVGADSRVVLIDCDSAQVNANGTLHLCEVGVAHFTPPELQGLASFDGVVRTANHDNFGLALLVFHLLFAGRHPFSGVPKIAEAGLSLEADIKALRYAYSKDALTRGVGPPPNAIPVTLVPASIQAMFEQAFGQAGLQHRPTAGDWVQVLDQLRRNLQECTASFTHVYTRHQSQCPWCALERKGGVFFLNLGRDRAVFARAAQPRPSLPAGSIFDLAQAWAFVDAVAPPTLPQLPDIGKIAVTAMPAPAISRAGQLARIGQWLCLIATACLILYRPDLWLLPLMCAAAVLPFLRTMAHTPLKRERALRKAALVAAEAALQSIAADVKRDTSVDSFKRVRLLAVRAREDYKALDKVEVSEFERLRTTARQRQATSHLERFFIDRADIPGLGPVRKATLRSFGIETAADVDVNRVNGLPGFGSALTLAMHRWRRQCEASFVYNPAAGVSAAELTVLHATFATRRREIEHIITTAPAELAQSRAIAAARLGVLQARANQAALVVAQAAADYHVLA